MWGVVLFTLGADRFALIDTFDGSGLGPEWRPVEADAALRVFDRFVRSSVDHGSALARLLSDVDDRLAHDAADERQIAIDVARVRRALAAPLGRIELRKRNRPTLNAPPPQAIEPVLEPEAERETELTFITFDLFDQTGERLDGMPFELTASDQVIGKGALALGHVHQEDLDPGTQATLALPDPTPPADQTLAISLKDAEGAGLANQAFEILLADGTRRSGLTDGSGNAELQNLPAGKALVRFPDLADSE